MEKKRIDIISLFWILISLGLFVLIGYINITRFNYLNFSDPSSEMFEYFKAIMTEKKLIPSAWKNSNELLIRRNIFTALPIYAITKDLLLTYQINSVITNLLLVISFIYLLKRLNISLKLIPAAVAALLGMFNYGDVQTLLFITQGYSVYAMILFYTIGYLIRSDKSSPSRIGLILCVILAIYMGITGIKMTLLLYIPLIIVDVFFYTIYYIKTQKILNEYIYHLGQTILICFFNVAGVLIFAALFSQYTSNAYYSFRILPLTTIIPNFYKQIVACLSSIGISTNGTLLSFVTIDSVYKTGLLMIGIGEAIYLIKKCPYSSQVYAIFILGGSVSISMIAMAAADFRISSRYYFITPFLVSLLLIFLYQQILQSHQRVMIFFASMLLLGGITLNFATYYRQHLIGYIDDFKQYRLSAIEKLEEEQIETIFGSRWNANSLSGFTNGKLDTGNICFGDFKEFDFLTNTSYFQRDQKVAILVTDFQENLIYSSNLPSKRFLNLGNKQADIGDANLYYYTKNPLKSFQLPQKMGEEQEFNLSGIDCEIMNGKLNFDRNEVISNFQDEDRRFLNGYVNMELGEWEIVLRDPIEYSKNVVLTGPDVDIESGIYQITLEYETLYSEKESVGSFSITSDNGSNLIDHVQLFVNNTSASIIASFTNAKSVDFTVKRNEDSQFAVKKITVRKMN